MKRITSVLFLVIVISAFIVTPALAGSNPKGKPFVYINDQIVEVKGAVSNLQDQVEDLIGRVDSIEARLAACEGNIVTLQNNNAALQAQIIENGTDIASLEDQIAVLQAENTPLQAQIDANEGNIENLQSQVDANQQQIEALQADVQGLSTLQESIEANEQLIAALQDEIANINIALELKQNIINQTCPSGKYLKGVLEDGSILCETDTYYVNPLKLTRSYIYGSSYAPVSCRNVYVSCENNQVVLDAEYSYISNGWIIQKDIDHANNYAVLRICPRYWWNDMYFSVFAVCIAEN